MIKGVEREEEEACARGETQGGALNTGCEKKTLKDEETT